jgi:hypothetical protein
MGKDVHERSLRDIVVLNGGTGRKRRRNPEATGAASCLPPRNGSNAVQSLLGDGIRPFAATQHGFAPSLP